MQNALPLGDGFIDIVIHGSGTKFLVEIEGVTTSIEVEKLASFINAAFPDKSKAVRLLSCNNLEAAQELGEKLGRDVIATDGLIYLTDLGEIGTHNTDWFKISHNSKTKITSDWDRGPPRDVDNYILLGEIEDLLVAIISNFKNKDCVPCSNEIIALLKKYNLSGQTIEVTTPYPHIWSTKFNGNITDNGYHIGVIYNGLVYDNLTEGLNLNSWKNDLDAPFGKIFFDINDF